MPEQTYGGDDDKGGTAKAAKKIDLKKYASMPDINVRDIFWQVMESYREGRALGKEDFSALEHHNISLLRIAVSELGAAGSYHGISKQAIATYMLMLCIDAGWKELAAEFIAKSFSRRNEPDRNVAAALNRLYAQEKYIHSINSIFTSAVRNSDSMPAAIAYLGSAKNKELVRALKRELMIIARNDVEMNQYNAIIALSHLLGEDEEIKSLAASLLAHWDEDTRRLAATLLRNTADQKVIEAAKKQMSVENNEGVRKALAKIAKIEGVFRRAKASPHVKKLRHSLEELKKKKEELH
jgi:hypothetical protein